MPGTVDLELGIAQDDRGYSASLRIRDPRSAAYADLAADVPVHIDEPALLALSLNPEQYGQRLTAAVFADPRLQVAWAQAEGYAQGADAALRLILRLAPTAEHLHHLRWELLRAPGGGFLATSEHLLFSRYLPCDDIRPVALLEHQQPRALVAIANPQDLARYQLSPVDVPGELARIKTALGDLPSTDLAGPANRPTLAAIAGALRDDYELLYLVCHGSLVGGVPYLWLENPDGTSAQTPGAELVRRIADLAPERRPLLVVLASCASGGDGDRADVLAALGPQLVRAGVGAVLAMQGQAPVQLIARFMPTLFAELQRDGQVDRAVAAARAGLALDEPWWMPVLFMRVEHGRLWKVATPPLRPPRAAARPARVFVSYKRNVVPDEPLALRLRGALAAAGHDAFIDQGLTIGVDWAREIQRQIESCDYLIPLLSAESVHSEMVAQEITFAAQHHAQTGRSRLLPVRVNFHEPLPYQLSHVLDAIQYALWTGEADDGRLLQQLLDALDEQAALPSPPPLTPPDFPAIHAPRPAADPRFLEQLREPGGTVHLSSQFYIERAGDEVLRRELLQSFGTTTTIRAARQTGKSSLLIRGVRQARQAGAQVVLIDLQPMEVEALSSLDSFLKTLAMSIVMKLRLDPAEVERAWRGALGPSDKLTYLMEEYVLLQGEGTIVLALDEADRLLRTPFHDSFFGLLRFWCNSRAINELWDRLDIVMVISTEPHLLISDVTQSPFNVGTRIRLEDFSPEQIAALNERYQSPLTLAELPALRELFGGHPYLVSKALYSVATRQLSWPQLLAVAAANESPFGDHLRRYLWMLRDQPELRDALRQVAQRGRCPDEAAFYRLMQAGLIVGADSQSCSYRCRLYEDYLKDKL